MKKSFQVSDFKTGIILANSGSIKIDNLDDAITFRNKMNLLRLDKDYAISQFRDY